MARRAHGMRNTPEYSAWTAMNSCCSSPTNKAFAYYGGGIVVCDRWRASFLAFLADMGERPSANHSLDRIDNDRGYGPDNCRWATRGEQLRNRRGNVWIDVDGMRLVAADWAKRCGISHPALIQRLRNGWSERDAVLTPNGAPRAEAR